ncbi:MAG: T9SS type A sorting domain-containing protein [Bacteroidia bacterium]
MTTIFDIPRNNGLPNLNPIPDCNLTAYKDGETVYASFKRNLYDTTYTFASPGRYELRYSDMNRTGTILNVPNPGNTPLYLSLAVEIDSLQDEAPQLLNESIFALACNGTPWQYNPIAFDPDGDSLTYALESVWEYNSPTAPQPISGYQFPDDASFGGGLFQINPNTGLVLWDAPTQQGLYVFAIRVKSYRNGQLRTESLQEMPIIVTDCDNTPPNFVQSGSNGVEYAHVGQGYNFSMTINGGAVNDSLYVDYQLGDRATAGVFTEQTNNYSLLVWALDSTNGGQTLDSLPVGLINSASVPATVELNMSWTPNPADEGKDLQFDVLAHNKRSYLNAPMQAMLTTYQSVRFEVLSPVPIGISAQANSWGGITVSWTDFPYDTAQFYRIYRVKDSLPDLSLPCAVREDTAHFEYLGYTTSWAPKVFGYVPLGIDAQTLCYVVTAAKGNAWDITEESCPSAIACVEAFTTPIDNTIESTQWILEAPTNLDGFVLRNLNGQAGPISYLVIDTQGRSVLQGSSTQSQIDVRMSHLPEGMYWVLILQDGKRQSLPYLRR